jgi:cupin 2 domain-containing protein
MRTGNLRRGIPALLPDELLTPLAHGRNVRVERIVSRGHTSAPGAWYDQAETELVFLMQGHARLEIEGQGELDLSPFDFVELPPHVRHRVTFTAPNVDTIWLAIFYERTEDAPALPRWSELPKGDG